MTLRAHQTVETVTEENFDEGRYLAANPDLRDFKRDNPTFDARAHFRDYGRKEGRSQLAAVSNDRRKHKYDRFASILRGEGYHFLTTSDQFPMISDGAYYDLADYEGESANPTTEYWINELSSNSDGAYLDLGCGLRNLVFDNCLYVEVYPSLSADIVVTPNAPLPIEDESLDGLYCAAVLEHVENPFFTASEIKRVVKTGGHIFVDWPFLQPVHGYPSHFYNATRMGLQKLFEDTFEIEQLSTTQSQSAAYTLHWILGWFISSITDDSVREKMCNMTVGELGPVDKPLTRPAATDAPT